MALAQVDESSAVLCTMSCGDCVRQAQVRSRVGAKRSILSCFHFWSLMSLLYFAVEHCSRRGEITHPSRGSECRYPSTAEVMMDSRLLHCGTANTSDLPWPWDTFLLS